ncbi:MAG: hypothetical protein ACXAEN_16255 [Candidatus Thorarchaeota archaeon]
MRISVLLIDDDKDLLSIVEMYLGIRYPEFDIETCTSAQDALQRFRLK